MKIVCDNQETATIIRQLCDIGLKTGGLQNLNAIVAVLNNIVIQQVIQPELPSSLENKLGISKLPAAILNVEPSVKDGNSKRSKPGNKNLSV